MGADEAGAKAGGIGVSVDAKRRNSSVARVKEPLDSLRRIFPFNLPSARQTKNKNRRVHPGGSFPSTYQAAPLRWQLSANSLYCKHHTSRYTLALCNHFSVHSQDQSDLFLNFWRKSRNGC